MEIGKKQILKIDRFTSVGAFLKDKSGEVLLPKAQTPKDADIGDEIEVFVYKDSSDRIIATTKMPYIEVGSLGCLELVAASKIGYFLDMGLERDIFLPHSETVGKVREGDRLVVAAYVDKSGRLCCTMKVKDYLKGRSPYKINDSVKGFIYRKSPEKGLFVAVDLKYDALVPPSEIRGAYRSGDEINLRVSRIMPDGKMILSFKQKEREQSAKDTTTIVNRLKVSGGHIAVGDSSHPALIYDTFGMSKTQFKRAAGILYKKGEVKISDHSIDLIEKHRREKR